MAYKEMALVYDDFMQDAPYDEWVRLTETILARQVNGNNGIRVADLGCGTGQITTKLAEKGFQMVGVDYAEEMLSIANERMVDMGTHVQWIHQDLRSLEGLHEFDAAISYCDVMNYITDEAELTQVFHHIHEMLKPQGTFIFDVHSLYHMKEHLMNQTFAEVTDMASYIWFCTPGEKEGEVYHDLTFFAQTDDDHYERFDEQHHQKTYSSDFYVQLLKQTGFQVKAVFGDFSLTQTQADNHAERIFFLAEKK